jgi:hypothetical protein
VKRGVEEGNALDIGQFFSAKPDDFQGGEVVSDPVRAEDSGRERKTYRGARSSSCSS